MKRKKRGKMLKCKDKIETLKIDQRDKSDKNEGSIKNESRNEYKKGKNNEIM